MIYNGRVHESMSEHEGYAIYKIFEDIMKYEFFSNIVKISYEYYH